MITVDQLPEKAIDAARLAMAIALADDGDGIPEAIVAAINAWSGIERVPGDHEVNPYLILPLTEKQDDQA